ncbi:hypothetical protein MLB1_15600 [Mycobacteroides sp. LB1]|nr:hypothetical protein [Mycobacteroides sp. LB1]
MQIARIAILICFLPVLLYRAWRLVRYPTSLPAVAVTSCAVTVWVWLLAFTDWVWAVLPPVVRATSIGGGATVTIAACLQVFAVGISADVLPARIRRDLRIVFTVAALVLTAVAVCMSNSHALTATDDLYTLANVLMNGRGDRGSNTALVVSNTYLIVVLVQLVWLGLRNADATPVGTGLGLLGAAAAFEILSVVSGGIWRMLSHGHDVISSYSGMWLQSLFGCLGAGLMIMGLFWAPVMLRTQARRDKRRLRPLHDALANLFPGLFPPMESRIRLSDLVFEWMTHIQDGLTLLVQRRGIPVETGVPIPADQADHVLGVMNWISGQSVSGFSCEWLRPPTGVSDQNWVLAIADAYRNHEEDWVGQEAKRESLSART